MLIKKGISSIFGTDPPASRCEALRAGFTDDTVFLLEKHAARNGEVLKFAEAPSRRQNRNLHRPGTLVPGRSIEWGSGFPYCRYFFGTDFTDFAVFLFETFEFSEKWVKWSFPE